MDREGNRVLSQHAVGSKLDIHDHVYFMSSAISRIYFPFKYEDIWVCEEEISEVQLDLNLEVTEIYFRDCEKFAEWEMVEADWLMDFWEGVEIIA